MGMEVGVFLAYASGMLLVYVMGKCLLVPLKWILCCIGSSLLGGAVIWVLNLVGSIWGIFIPLNVITALFTGVLGVPGLLLLLLFFI